MQSLKKSQGRKDSKFNSLEFARRSYILNPDSVDRLLEKYPNELTAVNISARKNINPEKKIESYLVNKSKLSKKYPDELTAVKHFALRSKDSEKDIEKYLVKKSELLKEYPDELTAVKHFALGSKDPEKDMEKYTAEVSELSKKYPNKNISIIKKAVFFNTNPEQYLLGNE